MVFTIFDWVMTSKCMQTQGLLLVNLASKICSVGKYSAIAYSYPVNGQCCSIFVTNPTQFDPSKALCMLPAPLFCSSLGSCGFLHSTLHGITN